MPAAASRPDHAYARGGHADEGSDSACSWEWVLFMLTFRWTDVGVKFIWWFANVNTRDDTVVEGHDLPRLFAQDSCLPHLDPQRSCRPSHLRRCGRIESWSCDTVDGESRIFPSRPLRTLVLHFKLPPGSRRLMNARRTFISPCEVREPTSA